MQHRLAQHQTWDVMSYHMAGDATHGVKATHTVQIDQAHVPNPARLVQLKRLMLELRPTKQRGINKHVWEATAAGREGKTYCLALVTT